MALKHIKNDYFPFFRILSYHKKVLSAFLRPAIFKGMGQKNWKNWAIFIISTKF